jgi:hypothetical protein
MWLIAVLALVPALFALEVMVLGPGRLPPRSAKKKAKSDKAVASTSRDQAPASQPPAKEANGQAKNEKPPPASASDKSPSRSAPVSLHLREALGGLTGSHLSQGHLNIGLIADAVEGEVYTKAQGSKLLDGIADLLATVGKKVRDLPPDSLQPQERKHLEQAARVEKLLQAQIKDLRLYWDSGGKEHADRFQKARQQSWTALQQLLRPAR